MASKEFQTSRAALGAPRDALWRKLVLWADHTRGFSGHVVGCAWTKPTAASVAEGGTLRGLQFSVVHTVVGVLEYKQFRLVRLRNPWGKSFFRGEWSNGSPLWLQAPPQLVDLALHVSGGTGPGTAAAAAAAGRGNGGGSVGSGSVGSGSANLPPPPAGDGSDYMQRLGLSDPTCFWMSVEDFLQVRRALK
jgi:hypothetical protein